jgi:hypothetical protein
MKQLCITFAPEFRLQVSESVLRILRAAEISIEASSASAATFNLTKSVHNWVALFFN